jgi:Family of unknown function (DUF6778)
MKTAKMILALGLGLVVSACASVDVPTRNTPFEPLPNTAVTTPTGYEATQPEAAANTLIAPDALSAIAPGQSLVSVNSIVVRVPRSLKVSEANRLLPRGDIVWRGDPLGDRYAQVQMIFQAAMAKGVTTLDGPVNVDIDIQVQRFHALTEKARYTTGGVHAITFDLAIKDPATGELLVPIRTIKADLDGFGGRQAIQAEARGLTQKVRITNHLAEVIRQELSNPQGYKNASLGFYQMLNSI